jgi:hypothetical protein
MHVGAALLQLPAVAGEALPAVAGVLKQFRVHLNNVNMRATGAEQAEEVIAAVKILHGGLIAEVHRNVERPSGWSPGIGGGGPHPADGTRTGAVPHFDGTRGQRFNPDELRREVERLTAENAALNAALERMRKAPAPTGHPAAPSAAAADEPRSKKTLLPSAAAATGHGGPDAADALRREVERLTAENAALRTASQRSPPASPSAAVPATNNDCRDCKRQRTEDLQAVLADAERMRSSLQTHWQQINTILGSVSASMSRLRRR